MRGSPSRFLLPKANAPAANAPAARGARTGGYVLLLAAATALLIALPAGSQMPAPVVTPPTAPPSAATPAVAGEQAGEQSREARIVQYQDHIRRLVETRRQAEEAAKKLEEAGAKPEAAAQPTSGPPAVPGPGMAPSPLPPGPGEPPAPQPAEPGGPPPALNLAMRSYLQIDPPSVSAVVGDVFDTRVLVQNPHMVLFDEAVLVLTYPPETLELLKVSDAPIGSHARAEPVYENNATSGTIYYRADIDPPYHFNKESLLQMRWRARHATPDASIQFAFDPASERRTTALRLGGVDRLGTPESAVDGVIGGEVFVDLPEKTKTRPIYDNLMASLAGGMRLRMNLETPQPRAGEEAIVSVALENPRARFLDTVRIHLWFDPQCLEMVDWDRGNWIHRGVNAWDGFAHDKFPFTYHLANSADNLLGELVYEMGVTDRFVPPDGLLFRVKFRAKAGAVENLICFDITPSRSGPATALFFEGGNVTDYAALLREDTLFLNVPIAAKK